MAPPEQYRLAPEATPQGPPRNVGQAYARYAQALRSGEGYQPDFQHAVRRHRLIAAIERSSAEGRSVSVSEFTAAR